MKEHSYGPKDCGADRNDHCGSLRDPRSGRTFALALAIEFKNLILMLIMVGGIGAIALAIGALTGH